LRGEIAIINYNYSHSYYDYHSLSLTRKRQPALTQETQRPNDDPSHAADYPVGDGLHWLLSFWVFGDQISVFKGGNQVVYAAGEGGDVAGNDLNLIFRVI
jgi:hypothetical protein